MNSYKTFRAFGIVFFFTACIACKVPAVIEQNTKQDALPPLSNSTDTTNTGAIKWRDFFKDEQLVALIDAALQHNQELNIALQEIEIARNEIRARKGELLPFVTGRGGIGVDKVARYTSQGAGDAATEITPGKAVPEVLPDQMAAAYATWEIDVWKKLRNARKAAITRYLATVEGRNFVITNLVAEIANTYYELLALDNQLDIVKQNIQLQQTALGVIKVQKEAATVTELAVKKFEAEVFHSQSLEFEIQQKIQEAEARLNFLVGRYPQTIARSGAMFMRTPSPAIQTGTPSQLLANRPDIRQAELNLQASKLDVLVARAAFYPRFDLSASLGLQAFSPTYLTHLPESALFSLAGDVTGPLVNKHAIYAAFNTANAKQKQALLVYQQTVLNAYAAVATQVAGIDNLQKSYALKDKQVKALTTSIQIADDLFKSARADYMEVLMTQRDALDARLELVETRLQQLQAVTQLYRNLGGGWK